MNIGSFSRFLEDKNIPIKEWEKKVQDNRERPQILPGTIFKVVREMPIWGQKSLLEVDEFCREDYVRKWHQSLRKIVASDTTIERSLEGYHQEPLREILTEEFKILNYGEVTGMLLPSGRRMRVSIVDGSNFGGIYAAAVIIAGMVNIPLDIELYTMGKELVAAKEVLTRVKRNLKEGSIDIVLSDSLYLNQHHILQCKNELGCESLIKTEDESITLIQDAKGIFFRKEPENGDGIERVEGLDINRGIKYQITACGGFYWQDIPFKLKVAHVREEHLKPIKGRSAIEEFWVVTTDVSLSAEDMRELAHKRWEIENNTFKRLNGLVWSKRRITKKVKVREVLLLMWFIGVILLGYYLLCRQLQGKKKSKETWRWVTQKLRASLVLFMVVDST